jgi:hypothetical protein
VSIVIPCFDEAETVPRLCSALDGAVAKLAAEGRSSEVIVVDDGSTDGTGELAAKCGARVLPHTMNRGYGAALKTGFAHGRGDLVSFLDADGTCDPLFFIELCRAIDDGPADIVLGSRMGKDSEMPMIRAVGNTVFAWILGILSRQRVDDTASGMRVIRRSALEHLYPLPDGLHFTPAMSARALMEGRLRLLERPMKYAERVGRSKLSVVKDGVRFLTCILQAAVAYRPARPLLLGAALIGVLGLLVAASPVWFYAGHARLEEWMIYRLLLASLLVTSAAMLTSAAVVADRVAVLAHGRPPSSDATAWVTRLFNRRNRRIGGVLLALSAAALVWPGLVEYVTTAHVTMHWSRAALASLLLALGVTLATTTFLIHMLELIAAQRVGTAPPRPPDRIHRCVES